MPLRQRSTFFASLHIPGKICSGLLTVATFAVSDIYWTIFQIIRHLNTEHLLALFQDQVLLRTPHAHTFFITGSQATRWDNVCGKRRNFPCWCIFQCAICVCQCLHSTQRTVLSLCVACAYVIFIHFQCETIAKNVWRCYQSCIMISNATERQSQRTSMLFYC